MRTHTIGSFVNELASLTIEDSLFYTLNCVGRLVGSSAGLFVHW